MKSLSLTNATAEVFDRVICLFLNFSGFGGTLLLSR